MHCMSRIKHATIAHGFVKSVDTSAAEQIPGVVKVLTCFDVPEHPFPTAGHPWSMDPGHQDVADRHLLNRHVRYYGDDVAVVIAENEVAAMQGVRALQVEYEELPFVLDVQKAMEPGAPQLHEAYPNNILKHTDIEEGRLSGRHSGAGPHQGGGLVRDAHGAALPHREPRLLRL